MDDGGWNILNLWLADAKKTGNAPLLIEIIQVSVITIDNADCESQVSVFDNNNNCNYMYAICYIHNKFCIMYMMSFLQGSHVTVKSCGQYECI